jgi:hypothetical protein
MLWQPKHQKRLFTLYLLLFLLLLYGGGAPTAAVPLFYATVA